MKLGIIGSGLIGGSLGLALKSNTGDKYTIYCYNRTAASSQKALDLGAVDAVCDSIGELTELVDIIVICTPLDSYKSIIERVSPYFNSKKVLTDVGSVKLKTSKLIYDKIGIKLVNNFIPCHPIAGKELGGIENAEPSLFKDKDNIITVKAETSQSSTVREIWRDAGAKNIVMSLEKHDKIFAKISHLPQYLSYILKGKIKESKTLESFTRLGKSPYNIWESIFELNKTNIEKAKLEFIESLKSQYAKLSPKDFTEKAKLEENDIFFAVLIAWALKNITVEEEKFSGSGYKSFISILENVDFKNYKVNAARLDKQIKELINELEEGDISRNL